MDEWKLKYLEQLEVIKDYQARRIQVFWHRYWWLRWATFPAFLVWVALWYEMRFGNRLVQVARRYLESPSPSSLEKFVALLIIPSFKGGVGWLLWWARVSLECAVVFSVIFSLTFYTILFVFLLYGSLGAQEW